ncbi:hypothetical protein Q664_38915 [Archangium violaceum Cb vi76]|uniref:Uncharacterized protein n=1 Tax=Archangium violaceum Cb vi76 TaxID=1406225 RepID=A0A084SK95_9BACT|nr:hypothetical protein Q664_38915 [Archangium violaceum Cb vi76]
MENGQNIHRPGALLRIPLADGSFGYGRVLEPPHDAFYEYRTNSPDADLDRIASKPILFKVAIRHSDLSPWEIIGWRAIEEPLAQPIVQFRQDVGDFRRCKIFDTAGNSRDAEPQECVGLERLAVWEQSDVEERLLDTFMGRPNFTVEHLKVRLR